MNCDQARHQDLVEKYVSGQLLSEDMTAFEEHYFGCNDCLMAVQLGQAIHFGADKPVAEAPKVIQIQAHRPHVSVVRDQASSRNRVQPRWMYLAAAAAGVIVVSLIGWRVFQVQPPSKPEIAHSGSAPIGNPAPATPEPVNAAPSQPPLMASNVDPGAVDPLGYRSSVLRGGSEDSSTRFQKVMESYLKHDYRQTVVGLSSIPVAVPGSGKPEDHITDAGIQLYLGISQLMVNQNAEAIRSLRRAAAYGDTPYLENADFFLAKGLIRQKQYAAAADQLQRAVQLKGDRQAEAQKLLEQVKQLQTR